MIILIYIASLKHLSCQICKEIDKNQGISATPYTILFDDPYSQTTPPNYTHIHQKMRKGCRNDYIEAFCAVYWAKNMCLKQFYGGLQQSPFGGRGLNVVTFSVCIFSLLPLTTVNLYNYDWTFKLQTLIQILKSLQLMNYIVLNVENQFAVSNTFIKNLILCK